MPRPTRPIVALSGVAKQVRSAHRWYFDKYANFVEETGPTDWPNALPAAQSACCCNQAKPYCNTIYQFDSTAHLPTYEASPIRRGLPDKDDRLSGEQRSTTHGSDAWFNVPANTRSQRWKTFLLTWAATWCDPVSGR